MKTYILKTNTLMSTLCAWCIRKFYRCTNVVIIDVAKNSGSEVLADILACVEMPNVFIIGCNPLAVVDTLYKNKIPVKLIRWGGAVDVVTEQAWGMDIQAASPMAWCWAHYGVGAAPRPYAILIKSRITASATLSGYGVTTMISAYLTNRSMNELDDILLNDCQPWMDALIRASTVLKDNNMQSLMRAWRQHEHVVTLGGHRVWCVNGGLLDGRQSATAAMQAAKEHGIAAVYGDSLHVRAYTIYSDGALANRELIKSIVSQYDVDMGSSGNVVQVAMRYVED